MNVRITPAALSGKVTVPPSKSVAHRLIICAALAKGRSVIDNVQVSMDISATAKAMEALGAKITLENGKAVVDGISEVPEKAAIDCLESGSTLRFLIPVAAALGAETEFCGKGKLPERPITPYLTEFPKHGAEFLYNGTMPFTVKGRLSGGDFFVDGGISSQFITGLLLALPLTGEKSRVILTSKLQSGPYVDITMDCMRLFGCEVSRIPEGYAVDNCGFRPCNCRVEGDYSQAAFFEVADSLGSHVELGGLNVNSFQGDKKIVEICREIVYNKDGSLSPFKLDCSDIPDLVPILAVLGCFCKGRSEITNAARLRLKESDRLHAMTVCLNELGGKVAEFDDRLVIDGVDKLKGGTVRAFNDHRIAMAMAVAATRCDEPVVIEGAECVSKSYPDFWEVYKSLGGQIEVME